MTVAIADPLSPELLRRYDVAGPRYTSYPTADRFVEAFKAEDYAQALQQARALVGIFGRRGDDGVAGNDA